MKYLTFAALLLMATTASGHDYAIGNLTIGNPYAFATVGNAPVGGGYLEITNTGDTEDLLIGVAVEEGVADVAQLHEMAMENGVMRMGEVEGGIVLPAGKTVVLKSGGLHVMFMRLRDGLEEGERIPATLTFQQAGTVEVVFDVVARGAAPAEVTGGDMDHGN